MPRIRIGWTAVVALVALRLALGCHFLYEGVWKIEHRDFVHEGVWRTIHREEFSAAPFLTQAKGPAAGFFYAMVPDLDARQRLHVATDAKGHKSLSNVVVCWDRIRREFLNCYKIPEKSATGADATATFQKFREKLDAYLAANLDDIEQYFNTIEDSESNKYNQERHQDAPFQKQRNWDRMMELRGKAAAWTKDIASQEQAYADALYGLLSEAQRQQGRPTVGWNPFEWDRMDQIDFAVTFGLTAIGFCLIVGLGTPLAALGGAAFMAFVVATQPAFPGIVPADAPILGHALLVNKDFIEMLALLVTAATCSGRWGGLDFFFACFWRCRKAAKQNRKLATKGLVQSTIGPSSPT